MSIKWVTRTENEWKSSQYPTWFKTLAQYRGKNIFVKSQWPWPFPHLKLILSSFSPCELLCQTCRETAFAGGGWTDGHPENRMPRAIAVTINDNITSHKVDLPPLGKISKGCRSLLQLFKSNNIICFMHTLCNNKTMHCVLLLYFSVLVRVCIV